MRQVRKKSTGNALIEYALPGAIILLTCGVVGSLLGVNDLMMDYFLSASGHTRSKMNGSTFNLDLTTSTKLGNGGNGGDRFTRNFARVSTQGNGPGLTSEQQTAMNQSNWWLSVTDANRDGVSQPGEYLGQWLPATGGSNADGMAAFNRVDMNNDGVLDATEIAADFQAFNGAGLDVPTYNRRLVYDDGILGDMEDSYHGVLTAQ